MVWASSIEASVWSCRCLHVISVCFRSVLLHMNVYNIYIRLYTGFATPTRNNHPGDICIHESDYSPARCSQFPIHQRQHILSTGEAHMIVFWVEHWCINECARSRLYQDSCLVVVFQHDVIDPKTEQYLLNVPDEIYRYSVRWKMFSVPTTYSWIIILTRV